MIQGVGKWKGKIKVYGENGLERNTHVLHIINIMSNVNDTSLTLVSSYFIMKLFHQNKKRRDSNQNI